MRHFLPGQFHAPSRIAHCPRIDRILQGGEIVGSLGEKRSRLRVLQGKGLVDIELHGISLDLRKVRIDRPVERQVRRKSPSSREAGFNILIQRLKLTHGQLGPLIRSSPDQCRYQFDILPGNNTFKSLNFHGLTQGTIVTPIIRRIIDPIVMRAGV